MKEMEEGIVKDLEGIEGELKEAKENAGEKEVREALVKRFDYLCSVYEVEKAQDAYEKAMEATMGTGQKIDLVFSRIRLSMVELDLKEISKYIEVARELIDKGGDWERRNRLKVYEATFLLCKRDIGGAAKLFLDVLATFAATELYDFKTLVVYTVVTALVSVDRPTLRDKVANAPEILSVILEVPQLNDMLNGLVKCDYKTYMMRLPKVLELINGDRYMSTHANYICREMRVVAYVQYLASYQSVRLDAMCKSFWVDSQFLDRELSRFVAAGRLNCKIDGVNGVVETTRPDAKNALYLNTIKQGDALLNRIQKLSRVIDV